MLTMTISVEMEFKMYVHLYPSHVVSFLAAGLSTFYCVLTYLTLYTFAVGMRTDPAV